MADFVEVAGHSILGGASSIGKSTQSSSTLLFSDLAVGNAQFYCAQEEITLADAATTDSTLKLLQANSIILAVSYYFTQAVAATDILTVGFGDSSTATRFGSKSASANAIAVGSNGVLSTHLTTGIASATTGLFQASAASLRLTPTKSGGSFGITSGKVRVCVYGIKFTAPAA